jgi:hypothetical protein
MTGHAAKLMAKRLPLGEAQALVGLAFKEWPNNGASIDEWANLQEKGLVEGNFDITKDGRTVARAARKAVKEEWI